MIWVFGIQPVGPDESQANGTGRRSSDKFQHHFHCKGWRGDAEEVLGWVGRQNVCLEVEQVFCWKVSQEKHGEPNTHFWHVSKQDLSKNKRILNNGVSRLIWRETQLMPVTRGKHQRAGAAEEAGGVSTLHTPWAFWGPGTQTDPHPSHLLLKMPTPSGRFLSAAAHSQQGWALWQSGNTCWKAMDKIKTFTWPVCTVYDDKTLIYYIIWKNTFSSLWPVAIHHHPFRMANTIKAAVPEFKNFVLCS